jgi:hypothetical protein
MSSKRLGKYYEMTSENLEKFQDSENLLQNFSKFCRLCCSSSSSSNFLRSSQILCHRSRVCLKFLDFDSWLKHFLQVSQAWIDSSRILFMPLRPWLSSSNYFRGSEKFLGFRIFLSTSGLSFHSQAVGTCFITSEFFSSLSDLDSHLQIISNTLSFCFIACPSKLDSHL